MIAAWLSKAAAPLLIAGAMLLAAAGLGWLTLKTIDDMVDTAASDARAERDHYWRAQIEQSNAIAQKAIADALKNTMAAQDAARDQVAAAEARATQLETENAALPDNGRCGLGRDRVRLLNKR
ncbi:MAG: hypothetical protein K0M55_19410 [Rhizobium sp.]|nr:hypothetical protein [Rhizobium sp.]